MFSLFHFFHYNCRGHYFLWHRYGSGSSPVLCELLGPHPLPLSSLTPVSKDLIPYTLLFLTGILKDSP